MAYKCKWALLKHSFTFVSHFIAEEGYSILTETSLQKVCFFFFKSVTTILFPNFVLVSREPLLYLEFNKPNKQNVSEINLF